MSFLGILELQGNLKKLEICFTRYLSHTGFLLAQSGMSGASSHSLSQSRPGLPYLFASSEAGTRAHQAVTPQFPYMVSEQAVELGVVIKCDFV